MVVAAVQREIHSPVFVKNAVIPAGRGTNDMPQSLDTLLTFKEAMSYLRVSRSTLYRLMWSNQLTGHKVGCTWRFYLTDLQASVQVASTPPTIQENNTSNGND